MKGSIACWIIGFAEGGKVSVISRTRHCFVCLDFFLRAMFSQHFFLDYLCDCIRSYGNVSKALYYKCNSTTMQYSNFVPKRVTTTWLNWPVLPSAHPLPAARALTKCICEEILYSPIVILTSLISAKGIYFTCLFPRYPRSFLSVRDSQSQLVSTHA